MDAGTYDFTFKVGTDWTQTFTMAGYNLTTYTAKLTIRDHWESTQLLQLTNGSGITLNNGSYVITITNAQSTALGTGKFVYDLQIATGGVKTDIQEGTITIRPASTK